MQKKEEERIKKTKPTTKRKRQRRRRRKNRNNSKKIRNETQVYGTKNFSFAFFCDNVSLCMSKKAFRAIFDICQQNDRKVKMESQQRERERENQVKNNGVIFVHGRHKNWEL